MNDSLCIVFRELSDSFAYHLLNVVKVILCATGAIRIAMQWKQYGVRFLVHNNTKVLFRFYYAINIFIATIFASLHLFELIRLRFDCFLLDFRFMLLTRGMGIAALYSAHLIIHVISFERLYSAFYPAHFEKSSSKLLSVLLATIAIVGAYIYSMMELSQNFRLFSEPKIYVALLTSNIPENKLGFQNLMRMLAVSNCLGLITLCVDLYVNFIRRQRKTSSLAVAYQRSENRRIVLILLPIEFTHTMLGFFSSFSLFLFGQLVSNPTPIGQQLFLESVTIVVYFPLILTFFIKRSVKIKYRRPTLVDQAIDHFESIQSSWDNQFDRMKNLN